MKCDNLKYFQMKNNLIEIIYVENSKISYAEHNHVSIYTIGFVLEGMMKIRKNGVVSEYFKNDIYVINPYMSHAIDAGSYGYSALTFCIKREFFFKYSKEKACIYLKNTINNVPIKDSLVNRKSLYSVINALENIYEEISYSNDSNNNMFNICSIIEKEPQKDISVDVLSEKMFYSKYYFIREFKKTVGLTPHKFQIQNRIRMAQNMMRKGENITKVALDTGFYDQSHFIKCFKKIVGVTPSEYYACSYYIKSDN